MSDIAHYNHFQYRIASIPTPIVTRHPALVSVLDTLNGQVDSLDTVLIAGEAGLQQHLYARALHNNGERKRQEYLALSPADIGTTTLDGLFFAGGTLTLHDVHRIPTDAQRLIVESAQASGKLKVVFTSSVPLDETVRHLYCGLDDFSVAIEIPSLRERKYDVELIAKEFLVRYNEAHSKDVVFHPDALADLLSYHWPGNVSEVYAVLKGAVEGGKGRRKLNGSILPHNLFFDASHPQHDARIAAERLKRQSDLSSTLVPVNGNSDASVSGAATSDNAISGTINSHIAYPVSPPVIDLPAEPLMSKEQLLFPNGSVIVPITIFTELSAQGKSMSYAAVLGKANDGTLYATCYKDGKEKPGAVILEPKDIEKIIFDSVLRDEMLAMTRVTDSHSFSNLLSLPSAVYDVGTLKKLFNILPADRTIIESLEAYAQWMHMIPTFGYELRSPMFLLTDQTARLLISEWADAPDYQKALLADMYSRHNGLCAQVAHGRTVHQRKQSAHKKSNLSDPPRVKRKYTRKTLTVLPPHSSEPSSPPLSLQPLQSVVTDLETRVNLLPEVSVEEFEAEWQSRAVPLSSLIGASSIDGKDVAALALFYKLPKPIVNSFVGMADKYGISVHEIIELQQNGLVGIEIKSLLDHREALIPPGRNPTLYAIGYLAFKANQIGFSYKAAATAIYQTLRPTDEQDALSIFAEANAGFRFKSFDLAMKSAMAYNKLNHPGGDPILSTFNSLDDYRSKQAQRRSRQKKPRVEIHEEPEEHFFKQQKGTGTHGEMKSFFDLDIPGLK